MKKKTFLAFIASVFPILFSCEKLNSPDPVADQDSDIVELISLEAAVDGAERSIDQQLFFGSAFLRLTGKTGNDDETPTIFSTDCFEISSESMDQEANITLTFSDDESCDGEDGDRISGTLKISIKDSSENTHGIITYEDLSVNGYIFNGTKAFDVLSSNENGNPQVTLEIDMTVETEDRIITKKGSRVVEQTEGADTGTKDDDVFEMTGASTYSDTLGNTFTVEIVSPLIKSAGCRYITEGIKHYIDNEALSVLDYGDGTCDSVATLTKPDGSVVEIELRYKGKGSINVD